MNEKINTNSFKQKLRRVLKDNTFNRKVLSGKGNIFGPRLSSYKTSNRIFKKNLPNSGIKYHLEILLDTSGSMMHWHGTNEDAAIYKCFNIAKHIFELFDGIVDTELYTFNLIEKKYSNKDILNFNLSLIDTYDKQVKLLNSSYIVTKDNHIIEGKSSRGTCAGNFEICNIVNSFHRLSKKDGKKIIIVIGDGEMRNDYIDNSVLIRDNYYIAGQSCKRYNPSTAEETCNKITKSGIHMFGIGIGKQGNLNYIKDRIHLDKEEIPEVFNSILEFVKKKVK